MGDEYRYLGAPGRAPSRGPRSGGARFFFWFGLFAVVLGLAQLGVAIADSVTSTADFFRFLQGICEVAMGVGFLRRR